MRERHVTDLLEIAFNRHGYCNEEALWRGSELHRAFLYHNRGTLERESVPPEWRGYLDAIVLFAKECQWVPNKKKLEYTVRGDGIVGTVDAIGKCGGIDCVADWNTGQFNPIKRLQTTLYGKMEDSSRWWLRIVVQLRSNGKYSADVRGPETWPSDLTDANAAVRLANFKIANGLEKQ